MVNLNNLFYRISELGLTAKKVSDATGISTRNISDWKNGRSMPSAIKLDILADHLDCSVDYLLGRTDNKNPPTENDEGMPRRLLTACQNLNEEGQERVALYAEDLASSGRYQKTIYKLPLVARGGKTVDAHEPVDEEALRKADEEHPPFYNPDF